MRADLNNGAVIEHGNLIAEAAGGKPVTYIDRRPVCHHLAESRIDFRFGNGVESKVRMTEELTLTSLMTRALARITSMPSCLPYAT